MKIAILGAGSLGCAIGGRLAEAGEDVALINRSSATVDAINGRGLRYQDDRLVRDIDVKAATDCSRLSPVDLLVVLVKSFHTREAIMAASNAIGPDTTVLSLQNGLGHEDLLVELLGAGRVLAGKTYVSGQMIAPGHVVAGVVGKQTYIGELNGKMSSRAASTAHVFDNAGLSTTVSPNIFGVIWDKLLVNVATGALSGITGLTYGQLYSVQEVRECALAAVKEAMAVAEAGGIALTMSDADQAWTLAAKGLPPDFKTSMLQSLEKGSITEVDFINGAVVRWGERHKVETPVNRTLVAAIKGIERRFVV